MKLGSLISGGKDSIFSIYSAEFKNNELVTLLAIKSENPDSWMFHTQNIDLVELQAEAMGKEIMINRTRGEKEEELEDLEKLVENAISKYEIEGLVVGAIESSYQRDRIEEICEKFDLTMIAPIWNIDEDKYMERLIEENFEFIITKVAAQGLEKDWLGRIIDKEALGDLKNLEEEYGIHLAGEGGEYETLVLDCPLFKRKIRIDDFEIEWKGDSGELNVLRASLSSGSQPENF